MTPRQEAYCRHAPYLMMPGMEDLLTREMTSRAREVRLEQVEKITAEQKASLYEVVLYLHGASLQFPLSETWTHIFMWTFQQTLEAEMWRHLMDEITLGLHEVQELDKLRRWIYSTQMKKVRREVRAGKGSGV